MDVHDDSDVESMCTTPYTGVEENDNAIDILPKKDSAEVIINMILCNPNDFEIKTRPMFIRKNFACTVNAENISIVKCFICFILFVLFFCSYFIVYVKFYLDFHIFMLNTFTLKFIFCKIVSF